MNKEKIKSIVIIILSIIVLALGGFILLYNDYSSRITEKVNDDSSKTTNTEESTETNEDSNESTISEENEIKVETLISYTESYYNLFTVNIPTIIGNTNTIKDLNIKIANETIARTYFGVGTHGIDEEWFSKGTTTNYQYVIKNDILVLYIYSDVNDNGTALPSTGSGLMKENYFYDIKEDKILTFEEAASKLNLKIRDYGDGIKDNIMIINNNEISLEWIL